MSFSDDATIIRPLAGPLRGTVAVPGDKSISHRAVLFAAMAEGVSRLSGVLDSGDVRSSLEAVAKLGAKVSLEKQPDDSLAGGIEGWGARGPRQPEGPIDCGNSGTTARLLMGVLAPWDIKVELTGDESLKRRPMRRIIAPLMKMGVRFQPEGRETLPVTLMGNPHLHAIDYQAPMASAQLKTAVLLAGLAAEGTTTLVEPMPSRNHTELMLPEFGAQTTAAHCTASVSGPTVLQACEVHVPGDPSSAAFLLCAALLKPGSSIQVENVSLGSARVGFLRVLESMGAKVNMHTEGVAGKEPFGTLSAAYTPLLHGCRVQADEIASLIDEIPVLALVAAHAQGVTCFDKVSELRSKESNRLASIVEGLTLMGIDAWVEGDTLYIEGQPGFELPEGLTFDSYNDHRLAMTWALAGFCKNTPISVKGFGSVSVSYPTFVSDMERCAR